MIVYKQWRKKMYSSLAGGSAWELEGWFLFGFIPLYVRRLGFK